LSIKTFLILIVLFTNIVAQQYNFIKYNVKDGLVLSQISKLNSYNDGRLIIATYGGGFNVYDGQKFTTINTTHGLVNSNIYSLVNKNDKLWIGTEKGLSFFDGLNFKNYYKKDGLPSELIWSLAVDNNTIWIGTSEGLAKHYNGKIEIIKNELVKNTDIIALFVDSFGKIWISTKNHLIVHNEKNNSFEKQKGFSAKNIVNSFSEADDGTIWFGTDAGLYKLFKNELKVFTTKDGITHNTIWDTYIDSGKKLWMATDEGLTILSQGKFIKCIKEQAFTDYKAWSITEDLERNIWIGTDEGLFKLNDLSFRIYKEANKKPIDAWTIVERSKNEYWLGSELQGVISFKNGKFSKIRFGDINVKGVSTLFIDQKNNTWITTENGIYKYSNNNFQKSSISYTNVTGPTLNIIQDKKGNLKFGTFYDGTIEFDGKSFHKKSSNSSETSIIFYYLIDSQEKLWAATNYGLKIITNDSMFTPLGFEWSQEYSFLNIIEDSNGYIWGGSYEGGLFGFNVLNINNPEFDTVSVKHGLNNESIMATTFDDDGCLWISTNSGINRFDVSNYHKTGVKNILSYDLMDGAPGVEGYQNGMLNDSDNNIIVSTIGGLVMFDPRQIKENTTPPTIKITDLRIIDSQFIEKHIDENEINRLKESQLLLPYDHKNLTIEYVGISLTNPGKVKYSYKLGNGNWSKPSTEAKTYLTNLSYGEYIFEVKASNNNGVWSTKTAILNFELIAPLWRKIWVQLVFVAILLGLILIFYLYRIGRMNKTNRDLEERIQERIKYESKLLKSEKELRLAKDAAEKADRLKSEFLAQMSHEIRTPLNSILSYTSLLREDVYDKIDGSLKDGFSIIENSSHRLIRTIDSILNMSQLQTGSFELNVKSLNVCNILSDLYTEFKCLAEKKNLKLNLILDPDECIINVDQYTITQMVANLIDNAIKYTQKGKIDIKLTKNSKPLTIIEVADTGIGMSEEFQKKIFDPFTQEEQGYTRKYDGAGLGLALVMKYAKLNNAKLTFSSKKNVGTTFKIELNN